MKKPSRAQIDDVMKCVPDVPKGYREHLEQEMLKRNRYLFYKRIKNKTIAVCSKCGETVELKKASHNEEAKCPVCKTKAIAKALNKAKSYEFQETFTLVQKIKLGASKGVVIRYVKAHVIFKHYDDTSDFPNTVLESLKTPKIVLWEGSRELWYEHYGYTKRLCLEFEYQWKTQEWEWINEKRRSQYYNKELLRVSAPIIYRKNLRTVFKDTPWKYCGIEFFKAERCNVGFYLEEYSDHKELEYVVKTGMQNLADQLVRQGSYNYHRDICYQLKELNKESLKRARRLDVDVFGIGTLVWLQRSRISINDEQFKWLLEYRQSGVIKELAEYAPLQKVISYIDSQVERKEIAAGLWVDYIRMSLRLGRNMTRSKYLYPEKLKESHDETSALVSEKQTRETELGLIKVWEKWHSILEFKSKDLKLIVPKSQEEFKKEGSALKICVGSNVYAGKMAKGSSLILMIRKDNTPYFTMEIDTELNEIIQLHGYDHCEATEEVNTFVDKWLKYAKKKMAMKDVQKSA
jgi:DNA-directed RNA polymerase subunit RPC12/RpoP